MNAIEIHIADLPVETVPGWLVAAIIVLSLLSLLSAGADTLLPSFFFGLGAVFGLLYLLLDPGTGSADARSAAVAAIEDRAGVEIIGSAVDILDIDWADETSHVFARNDADVIAECKIVPVETDDATDEEGPSVTVLFSCSNQVDMTSKDAGTPVDGVDGNADEEANGDASVTGKAESAVEPSAEAGQ